MFRKAGMNHEQKMHVCASLAVVKSPLVSAEATTAKLTTFKKNPLLPNTNNQTEILCLIVLGITSLWTK